MANKFWRRPIEGGDENTWAQYNDAHILNAIHYNNLSLYNNGGVLTVSQGRCGINDGTNEGVCIVDTVETVSINPITNGNWAEIYMTVSGSNISFTAINIAGATTENILPTAFLDSYDRNKGGYYINSTRRCIGIIWKTAGGLLSHIINSDYNWLYPGAVSENRYLYFASGTYLFWDEDNKELNVVGANNFKIDGSSDTIGIGGYAGGSNRDSWFYFASDAYNFWDESESELITFIAGAAELKVLTDAAGIGGYAGGSNRDSVFYFATDAGFFWDEGNDNLTWAGSDLVIENDLLPQNIFNDCGNATYYWNDVYADDFVNVADFFHLDSYDDLATIMAIKGSGKMDYRSGLEKIDDDTLPEWLLLKSKDGKKIERTEDGKPFLSSKTMISLCMGAIRQLKLELNKLKEGSRK